MKIGLKLESPDCFLSLETSLAEVGKLLASCQLKTVIDNQYFVAKDVISLSGVTHDLGLHFSNQKLIKIELFSFDLEKIDTEDDFLYLQTQLIKDFGQPTLSALQEGRFQQNQWVLSDLYQVTNNQSERGASIEIQHYNGAKLQPDGFWIIQNN